jgi:hypothetical protein
MLRIQRFLGARQQGLNILISGKQGLFQESIWRECWMPFLWRRRGEREESYRQKTVLTNQKRSEINADARYV